MSWTERGSVAGGHAYVHLWWRTSKDEGKTWSNDRPFVFVDGKSYPPMTWMSNLGRFGPECLGRPEYLSELWRIGIRIFFLPASVHIERWLDTQAAVDKLLSRCPDALVVFRVEHNLMPVGRAPRN